MVTLLLNSRLEYDDTTVNTGMMGSGKTTVGKLMSKVLGYSFFDWYVYATEENFICFQASIEVSWKFCPMIWSL